MTIVEAVIVRCDDLLKKTKMSKRQLCIKAGISTGTLASIYKKLARSVSLRTLLALSKGFGIEMSEFLDCAYFKTENLGDEKDTK